MGLHPKKYIRHVLSDVYGFLAGDIGYPEIDLKLGGEEAWLDAFPRLRDIVHQIEQMIRSFARSYNMENGGIPPESAYESLYEDLKPYIKELEFYLENGQLPNMTTEQQLWV